MANATAVPVTRWIVVAQTADGVCGEGTLAVDPPASPDPAANCALAQWWSETSSVFYRFSLEQDAKPIDLRNGTTIVANFSASLPYPASVVAGLRMTNGTSVIQSPVLDEVEDAPRAMTGTATGGGCEDWSLQLTVPEHLPPETPWTIFLWFRDAHGLQWCSPGGPEAPHITFVPPA